MKRKNAACVVGGLMAALMASSLFAAGAVKPSCQARIHRLTGDYLACRLDAEAFLAKGGRAAGYASKVSACDRAYSGQYRKALKRWVGACPDYDDSAATPEEALGATVEETVGRVRWQVSGKPPAAVAGKVILFNNCSSPLKLMSPSNVALNGLVLGAGGGQTTIAIADLNQHANNTILVAPQTSEQQCAVAACEKWTAVQPNTVQRKGFMWESPNQVFAAYCQPTNAAAAQCTTEPGTTPCCGPGMNYDKTFGTTLEITPFAGAGGDQDFINLSTNYGTDSNTPPPLCGPGVNPDDCVTAGANIFFNVPIHVDMSSGGACSMGTGKIPRTSLVCTEASCTDAYRHPVDDKQVACSSGGERGYVVTYCPPGAPLPVLK